MAISVRHIKKFALYLFSLILLFVSTVFIINTPLFDEELEPELKKILQTPKEIAPQTNAYLALMGLPAADDKAIIEVGQQLTARYLHNRDSLHKDELSEQDTKEILGGKNLDSSWRNQYTACKARQETNCLSKMQAQIQAQPMTSARYTIMLQRYQQLLEMRQFQELQSATYASPIPQYGLPLSLAKIHLAQLALDSDPLIFLTAVQKDMAFWRRVLSQSSTLIGKMIATAAIWSDLRYLSDYLQNRKLSAEHLALVQQLLAPLNQQELSVEQAMAGELRGFASEYKNAQQAWWNYIGFQVNATLNSKYRTISRTEFALSKLPAAQFAKSMSDDIYNLPSQLSWSPASLYNYTGKLLLQLANPAVIDYIARVHDLNGMLSLVRLQLALTEVPRDEVEALVKASAIKNPYTNQPMHWDKSKATLQFTCLSKQTVCQVKLASATTQP